MRMWLVDPKILCRKHLLGEHVELHMLTATLNLKYSISGYIENDLIQPMSIKKRHKQLVKEMLRRGYNHKSPLVKYSMSYLPKSEKHHKIDLNESLKELISRCDECKSNYNKRKNIL